MVKQLSTFLGAIAFYTCLPVPQYWLLTFSGIARWAPLVGLMIGSLLGLLDRGLSILTMPMLARSAIVVAVWVALTGGLHLDGAMDTADGLAVLDPKRRLQVMADSRTGAFGAMAAVIILLLKVAAFADITSHRWLVLMLVAGWGRWGQVVAIVRYPYLKPEGKGAFHKAGLRSPWEAAPTLVLLLACSGLQGWLSPTPWFTVGLTSLSGVAIALFTGAWFNQQLGGHTGDTYGAVVEWTEALLLCLMTIIV
ncbi:adenosylcobinamide-GDP ribazoletransferase [Stenomitos frigidus]|uniref:Adenosylcobinamide-GDP ribazoletransferase n=2 Tax=Stenomitos TaxID=1844270 RepID=A0A2T1DZQ0_9CYAN|nr:adenosylcobinamide-GDP ribazoletransferase [Stenomitos frigidus]PSB25962.1 adenosylcobinamide-GDP ribazoletransferase [Stenomitos frigidus ULC18]